jgi:hypothetical protein
MRKYSLKMKLPFESIINAADYKQMAQEKSQTTNFEHKCTFSGRKFTEDYG